jgi:hypothetical protein
MRQPMIETVEEYAFWKAYIALRKQQETSGSGVVSITTEQINERVMRDASDKQPHKCLPNIDFDAILQHMASRGFIRIFPGSGDMKIVVWME